MCFIHQNTTLLFQDVFSLNFAVTELLYFVGDSKFSSADNPGGSKELCIFWHKDKPGIVHELLRDKNLQGKINH